MGQSVYSGFSPEVIIYLFSLILTDKFGTHVACQVRNHRIGHGYP